MDINIFNFKPKNIIGIDIGTSSIKMVELNKKGGRFNLENYGIFELKGSANNNNQNGPLGAYLGHNILKLPDQEIVWGIKELLKRTGINSKTVIASIPSFSTFTTVIEMPYVSEEDLAKSISLEARKYVPIPMSEVVLDWSIIGIKSDKSQKVHDKDPINKERKIPEANGPTIVKIFLAAVSKNETTRYQNIMKEAGLKIAALELENSALIRGLLGNDLSPTAIVSIGGRSTSIMIVNKGYERLSHNYEIGGFEITKAISRSLSISLKRAEELKRQFGLKQTNENIVRESMVSLIDMMVFETKKTIVGYEESREDKISRIVLSGGMTSMPGFLDYFKKKIDRTVYLGNVFSRIVYDKDLAPAIPNLNNIFSVAVGLAMRGK
jgi:type IV pilus assembly protein PilM